MPVPDKRQLRRFCEIDGWEKTAARNPDHDRYRKRLDDGSILRTKISRGHGPACNDPGLWHHIWRDQLELTGEDLFCEVLGTGRPTKRSQQQQEVEHADALDVWLYEYLVDVVRLSSADISGLTAEAALRVYLEHVSAGDQSPSPRPSDTT